jgi:hypothetical protein
MGKSIRRKNETEFLLPFKIMLIIPWEHAEVFMDRLIWAGPKDFPTGCPFISSLDRVVAGNKDESFLDVG